MKIVSIIIAVLASMIICLSILLSRRKIKFNIGSIIHDLNRLSTTDVAKYISKIPDVTLIDVEEIVYKAAEEEDEEEDEEDFQMRVKETIQNKLRASTLAGRVAVIYLSPIFDVFIDSEILFQGKRKTLMYAAPERYLILKKILETTHFDTFSSDCDDLNEFLGYEYNKRRKKLQHFWAWSNPVIESGSELIRRCVDGKISPDIVEKVVQEYEAIPTLQKQFQDKVDNEFDNGKKCTVILPDYSISQKNGTERNF